MDARALQMETTVALGHLLAGEGGVKEQEEAQGGGRRPGAWSVAGMGRDAALL